MERYYSPAKGFTALVAEMAMFKSMQAEQLAADREWNREFIARIEDDSAVKSIGVLMGDLDVLAKSLAVDSVARRAREAAEAEADRAHELAEARRVFPEIVRLATELAGPLQLRGR